MTSTTPEEETGARIRGVKNTARGTGCSGCADYRKALEDTVQILKKTKSAFRSKDIGTLRQRLESLLTAGERSD